MSKVYRHIPLAPDEYLGRIETDGRVYEARFGPDHLVGRIDFNNGRVYETRFGPDRYYGRVDLQEGKVYLAKVGPDEYLGRVEKDGKCYLHKALAADPYLGRVHEPFSLAASGAAFLLLVYPASLEQTRDGKNSSNDAGAPNKD